jgi:N utilization substance protein B
MSSRRRSRQRALQILFLWDARRQPVDDAINAYYDTLYAEEHPERDPFVEALVHGTVTHLAEVDEQITKHAEHWRMERMPAVDRNILRLAVFEMTRGGTPAPVTIDEALELARKYSNEESVQFVNGVLDAIRREAAVGGQGPRTGGLGPGAGEPEPG